MSYRTNELASASLVDHPTNLFNRRAFEQDSKKLSLSPLTKDLVCVTADINGLKTVNDTLGHDAGDELIRGAADCLRTCFEPFGTLYRIGGDEFAAYLQVPPEEFEGVKRRVERTVDAWRGTLVGSLAVSCGYAQAREFPGEDLAGLCKISDQRMYEEKERYYQRTGAKRRGQQP